MVSLLLTADHQPVKAAEQFVKLLNIALVGIRVDGL
jgi:hypothetical protein